MSAGHVEIERKIEPGPAFVLPDLSAVAGVAAVGEPVEHVLSATYYDTADLRLARARITLRRRTGGTDAGWHLKLPAEAGAREERHHPLGPRRAVPPKAVLEPVVGIVRGAPVQQVATLRTTRLVTPLLDEGGRVLAEVADDRVTGTAVAADPDGAATVTSWRELEVELVDGDEAVLDAVVAAILTGDATASSSPSKLARVLADRLAAVSPAAEGGGNGAKGGGDGAKGRKKGKKARAAPTAGEVVVAALRDQVAALEQADLKVRTGHPEGIHDLRVACRRLRSITAAFRPVLDRTATDPLRAELRWVGAALSAARDGEVALAHLRELVAAQPLEQVRGPVVARLQTATVRDAEAGRRRALRILSDRRYLAVLDALDAVVADPPLIDGAGGPAVPALTDAVRHTGKRLAARVAEARAAAGRGPGDPGQGDAGGGDTGHGAPLHEVRKAAKRVRYTAEVAAPLLGRPAEALAACMEEVQDVLGAAQDTVATREHCVRLGRAAEAAGEPTWTWGRLDGLEEARTAAAAVRFWALEPGLRPAVRAATRTS